MTQRLLLIQYNGECSKLSCVEFWFITFDNNNEDGHLNEVTTFSKVTILITLNKYQNENFELMWVMYQSEHFPP